MRQKRAFGDYTAPLEPADSAYYDGLGTLQRGLVTGVTKARAPFSAQCVYENPNCEPGGINIDIFRALMGFLGLGFRFVHAEEGLTDGVDENGTRLGMIPQLERGEADMTATLISLTTERLSKVDFSAPVSYLEYAFVVKTPTGMDVRASPMFLLSPLDAWTWLGLVAASVVSVLILAAVKRVRRHRFSATALGNSLLQVIRAAVRQTILESPYRPVVIALVALETALFVVSNFYTAYLTSAYLVAPHRELPFHGLDEFAQGVYDKKYRLITDKHPSLFPPNTNMSLTDSADPYVKLRIAYRYNPPMYVKSRNEIVKEIGKNASLVYYSSYYRLLDMTAEHCELTVVVDQFITPRWLSFAFPKGSKLGEKVSMTLNNEGTTVNSFLQRLYKRYAKKRRCPHSRVESSAIVYEPLSFSQMQGSGWLVVYGIIVAAITLIFERLSHCYTQRKAIKEAVRKFSSSDMVLGTRSTRSSYPAKPNRPKAKMRKTSLSRRLSVPRIYLERGYAGTAPLQLSPHTPTTNNHFK